MTTSIMSQCVSDIQYALERNSNGKVDISKDVEIEPAADTAELI